MNVKIFVIAGLLGAVITTSDAYANFGGGGRHGHDGSGGSSGQVFNNGTNDNGSSNSNNFASVPEPSSLYALASALALVGATGWMLRRKK